ncbi:S8 family serine peptidase [Streptomyces mirabilis]|uniref:S8 family serine peptidase n=1 Tax=Streptomyces mirabilis TaxID=68239 RepID=UPI00143EC629|nr:MULTISPECIES: S8 family serine peptidase [Streptomyces]QIY74846.1 S8 family serine peptidase [Streptomyces sp. RLB1-33]QUW77996.1 S8 family serine peptidase [Streptomyces mirabilis]
MVTLAAGTAVTGKPLTGHRLSTWTPQTDNATVNSALRAVGAKTMRTVVPALSQTSGTAPRDNAASQPSAGSALSRTYVLQTTDRDSEAVAKRLRTTRGVAYAEPNRYVNTLDTPSPPLPASVVKAAARAGAAQAHATPSGATRTSPDPSGIPTNYALADSAQALLNAGGVNATGAFATLKGRFGQEPGAGEIITNVSIGDLVDQSMLDGSNAVAVRSGATTILKDGQRYLDLPSMPLIPTYVSDGQGGLSGSAAVQGEDPGLGEALMDFSVMSPLPHDQQRPGREGSGYTDLLGIAPGAKYRLVVPQTPTTDQIVSALMAAANQSPRPDVITASLGFGTDALGFAGRYLEDDPVVRAVVEHIVKQDGITVVISSNDGTRLFTSAAVGPDGGSTPTDLAADDAAATSLDDVQMSSVPSRDPDTGAIAAGGTTLDDTLAGPAGSPTVAETRISGFGTFSSGFGSRVNLSAPSDNIPSFLHPVETSFAPAGGPSDVQVVLNGGTSASAPEIAAAAAVVLQASRLAGHHLTPADVRDLLERTGRPVSSPRQIDRTVHVGPQIDVSAAAQAALGDKLKAKPALVRLSVAHRVTRGSLGGMFTETTDPQHIDLGDVASGGNGEGLVGPVTFAGDVTGLPSGAVAQYRLTEGSTVWRSNTPAIRVTPRQLLAAAGLPVVSTSDRSVKLRYDVLIKGHVVASADRTVTIGASDGTYMEAKAPTAPAVAPLGSPVTVHYDLTGVNRLSNPAIAVSGVGHWNPDLGPIFYPAWTQPLTATSGSVTIPASAFHGGAGLYGIGVIQKSVNLADNVYAEFTPIRIGTDTARPAAPLITDASGAAGHSATVNRANPVLHLGYDVSAVHGAVAAEVEFSAPGPARAGHNRYNTFDNPNGSQVDNDGINTPSTLHQTLPGTSGTARLDVLKLGLPLSELYNVRVLALDSDHHVIGQASPSAELEADDGLVPDDARVVDFAFAGQDSLVSLIDRNGVAMVKPYDPATGTYGAALTVDRTNPSGATYGATYAVIGASATTHRALVAHQAKPNGDVDLQVWDTASRTMVTQQTLSASDYTFVNGRLDSARNRGVVLLHRTSDDVYVLLPISLTTGASSAEVPLPVSGAGVTDPGAARIHYSQMAVDPKDGTVVVLPGSDRLCSGSVSAPRVDLDSGTATLAGDTSRCAKGVAIDDAGNAYSASNTGWSTKQFAPSVITKIDPTDSSDPVTVRQDLGLEFTLDGGRDLAFEKFVGPDGVHLYGHPTLVFDNDAVGQTDVVDLTTGKRVETINGAYTYSDGSPLMSFPGLNAPIFQDGQSIQLDPATRTGYTIGVNRQEIQQFSY